MKRDDIWTSEEQTFLSENGHLTAREIGEQLGRTASAVKNQRRSLGIVSGRAGGTRPWGDAEIAVLRENSHLSNSELAALLSRPVSSIGAKKHELGIFRVAVCELTGKQVIGTWRRDLSTRRVQGSFKATKGRAGKRGLAFDFSLVEFAGLVAEGCRYCCAPATGLDRIDNSQGYTKANSAPCCRACNVSKNDRPLSEWFAHMRRVLAHTEGTEDHARVRKLDGADPPPR